MRGLNWLRLTAALGVATILWAMSITPAGASNDAYGDGTYGSCTYENCPLTITSSGTVSLAITPATSAKCTIASDAVGVTSDSSTGYTLTLNDGDTNNSQTNGGNSITAVSASQAAPAALSANSWGYRVDGVGGFGAGPTSAASNISTPATTFAPVPLSSVTGDTLATSAAAPDPTVTTSVWYGACANASLPAGSYTDGVVYTAVIN